MSNNTKLSLPNLKETLTAIIVAILAVPAAAMLPDAVVLMALIIAVQSIIFMVNDEGFYDKVSRFVKTTILPPYSWLENLVGKAIEYFTSK